MPIRVLSTNGTAAVDVRGEREAANLVRVVRCHDDSRWSTHVRDDDECPQAGHGAIIGSAIGQTWAYYIAGSVLEVMLSPPSPDPLRNARK